MPANYTGTNTNIFINDLDNGIEGILSNLQTIQNWKEWLLCQMVMLPFSVT